MHIDNTYLTNRTLGSAEQPAVTPDAAKSAAAGATPPGVSAHVPSAELLDLLDQVRQTPEVRKEALQRVADKLASGAYLTREAALQTAQALRNAAD
jgi:hypothetical protein